MADKKWLVKELAAYIEDNLREEADLSLDCVEERFGYSKFYLNRLFSEQMGCTIHQYVMERRLTEAARELVDTDKAIVEIACGAGYQSQQAFTQAFRQRYGCSPLAYREKRLFHPLREGGKMCGWRCAA